MNGTAVIMVRLLHPDAVTPRRMSEGAAGYDLTSIQTHMLDENEIWKCPTGIAVEIPPGYELQIRGRSSMASKGIVVHLGTIDADYRGEISVVMMNLSGGRVMVDQGQRVAQMVLSTVPASMVTRVDKLSETDRGGGGFGSTGV